MEGPKTRNLLLLFGGLFLFAVFLIVGTNVLLRRIEPAPAPPANPLPAIKRGEVKMRIEGPGGAPDTGVRFIEPGAVADPRPVIYTEAGSAPGRVTVSATDAVGCLVTVINRSAAPLRVGVNPHSPAGDPGADYGAIAPGGSGLLDTRYPGFAEMTLHSHMTPAHEFTVVYGEGCK